MNTRLSRLASGAVLATLVCAAPLAAQSSFGARAGMTLSSFAQSEDQVEVSAIAGMHVGITASFTGPAGIGVAVAVAYSERGTGFTADDVPEEIDLRVRLGYAELEALGKVPLGAGPYLLAGPSLGLRVSCATSLSSQGSSVSTECGGAEGDDPFSNYDVGLLGGIGMFFDVTDFHMVVEGLYSFGVLNVADSPDDAVRNRSLIVRVGVEWVR